MKCRQTNARKSPSLSITLPRELIALIDQRAAQVRQSRSRFIAEALWQCAQERPVRMADLLDRLEAIEQTLSGLAPKARKPRA